MTTNIIPHRLHNQVIAGKKLMSSAEVVGWFGAMQAQDYASAKWAVGLRCNRIDDAAIEQAFAERTVVRTWLLRGTLHLVAAADVRWLLSLLSKRLIAGSAGRSRQLGLDTDTYARSQEVIVKALRDRKRLTRAEVMQIWEQAGISTEGQRGYHMLWHSGLEGLTCFGPMQGKQQTFVLLDEWVSDGKPKEREQALAELAVRYFQSHGPATLPDFVWWSGLTLTYARDALDLAASRLQRETIGSQEFWRTQSDPVSGEPTPTVHLLPSFDEYYLGYRERGLLLDPHYDRRVVSSNGIFHPIVLVDGRVAGIWKRQIKKSVAIITLDLFDPLSKAEHQSLLAAAQRYSDFLGLPVEIK